MIKVNIKKKVKTYKGTDLVEVNASFNVHETTLITGPSGAGKTTLLRTIAGLVKPEEGKIMVNDKVWLDTGNDINLVPQKRNIGFVFQDYALFPNMTVAEHLQYGSDDTSYIDRLIALGRLEAFRTHKPKYLSGGQQQRLAILRALVTKPELLLMDEPFSALDAVLKKDIVADLKVLLEEMRMTCLIVTHDPLETAGFAQYSLKMG